MRIAIVENTGSDFFYSRLRLCKFLKKRGYEITAIIPDDGYTLKIEDSGFKVLVLEHNIRGKQIKNKLNLFLDFYKIFRKNKFDIIHFFRLQPNLIGTLTARLTTKSKIINHITGLGYVFSKNSFNHKFVQLILILLYNFNQRLLKAKIVCQNTDDINDLFLMKSTTCIKGSSIDESRFLPSNNKLSKNTINFLFVSRIIKEKGIYELVEGFKLAADSTNVKIRLNIVGWFDENNPNSITENDLKKMISNKKSIDFTGKSQKVDEIISKTHVGILPTYYREGTPRFLLECMAMGKTIITTKVPGCSHLFNEEPNIGIMIEPRSIQAVKDAILKVINMDLTKTGKNSRKIYSNYFSEKIVFNEILNLYQN